MQPYPAVLAISLTYEGMLGAITPAILGALFARVETSLDLRRAYKGITQSLVGNLLGLLGSTKAEGGAGRGARYCGIFREGSEWSCFDDACSGAIGTDWAAVASHCASARIQPAVLFYALPTAAAPAPAATAPPTLVA